MWVRVAWPGAAHGEKACDWTGLLRLTVPKDGIARLPLEVLLRLHVEDRMEGRR